MSRRITQSQSRHHVHIFDEDWDFLERAYGRDGVKPIGISAAVRTIIHNHVKLIKQRQQIEADKFSGKSEVTA